MQRWYGKEKIDYTIKREGSNEIRVKYTCPVELKGIEFILKNTRHGKGCFNSSIPIPSKTFIGAYPGCILNEKSLLQKLSSLSLEKQKVVNAYLCCFECIAESSKLYLDPISKSGGNIDMTFEFNPILYINEPDCDQEENVTSITNYDTKRMEVWTKREIKPFEELFISYGSTYDRSYKVNPSVYNAPRVMFKDGELQFPS